MKIKCNYGGSSPGGIACFNISREDIGMFYQDISQYSIKDLLTIEVKKYKPLKTQSQLGLYFKAFEFLCIKLNLTDKVSQTMFRKGLEERFHLRKGTGVFKDGIEIRAPIPLSACDRFEQFNAAFEGLFIGASDNHVDMTPFILKWEQYKKEKTLDKKA